MSFNTEIHYDHLQFFVDELKPLEHYKAIEDQLNRFAAAAEKRCADTEMHHFLTLLESYCATIDPVPKVDVAVRERVFL